MQQNKRLRKPTLLNVGTKVPSPFIFFLFLQLLIGWVQLQTPAQGDLPSSHLHWKKKKKKPTVEVENWSFSWMALASVALCMPHVKVRDLSNLTDWPINRLNDTKTGSLIRMERNHWQIHVKITEILKKSAPLFFPSTHIKSSLCCLQSFWGKELKTSSVD